MERSVSWDWILLLALALYVAAIWLHIPYGGGHVYSDLVTVFQDRECPSGCTLPIPYVQGFIEYPPLTSFFIYTMGLLASLLPFQLLAGYYWLSTLTLLVPTVLLLRELRLIAAIRKFNQSRILWFFVATPTFLFTLLVNWYVVGTFFTLAGVRYYLKGRATLSGILLGLSAASNLTTAVPALGLLLSADTVRKRLLFLGAGLAAWGVINLPVYLLNPGNWVEFWRYHYSWYAEGSWMNLVLANTSPLRHVIPLVSFGLILLGIVAVRFRLGERDPVRLAFIATFGFVFSNYVYTPQMNVLLLPFLVMLPIPASYPEFLVFDSMNAFVILAFSQTLQQFLGLPFSLASFERFSPAQLAASIRSLWVGKFAAYDGLFKNWKYRKEIRAAVVGDRPPSHSEGPAGPYVPVSSLSLEELASEPPADSPTT